MRYAVAGMLLLFALGDACSPSPNIVGVQDFGRVAGRVLDAMTNRPIPNALVSVGSLYTTRADANGGFTAARRRRRSNRHRARRRLFDGQRRYDHSQGRDGLDRLHQTRAARAPRRPTDDRAAGYADTGGLTNPGRFTGGIRLTGRTGSIGTSRVGAGGASGSEHRRARLGRAFTST